MRLFGRISEIFAAYLVASLAAGLVAFISLILLRALEDLDRGMRLADLAGALWLLMLMLIPGTVAAAVLIMIVAVVPAAVVIAYSEARSQRSLWFYSLLGGAWGALMYLAFIRSAPFGTQFAGNLLYAVSAGLLGVVTGVTAGLVYWALAGRRAGAWRRPLPGAPMTAERSPSESPTSQ